MSEVSRNTGETSELVGDCQYFTFARPQLIQIILENLTVILRSHFKIINCIFSKKSDFERERLGQVVNKNLKQYWFKDRPLWYA